MLGSLKGMLLLFLSSPLLNDSREKGLTFGRGRRRRRPRLQEVEASRRHEDYVSFEGPITFKEKKKAAHLNKVSTFIRTRSKSWCEREYPPLPGADADDFAAEEEATVPRANRDT